MHRNDPNTLEGECIHDPSGAPWLSFTVNRRSLTSTVDPDGISSFTGVTIYVSSFRSGTVALFDNARVRAANLASS